MANEQINQYAVTATSFLPGSFMDIDQLIAPGVWESQKIDFSAMFTQFGNIYNYDGTITEQRTLDGNLKTKGLFFIELQTFTVRATALEFESDINITLITDPVGALIIPSDTDPAANVVTPLEFMVKGDTTANHILTYVNGAWETVALTSDLISIYNSDGTITGPRTIDANGNPLTFDNISNFYLENVGSVKFNDTANISFQIQLNAITSFNFGASSLFNASLNIGTDTFPSSTRGSVMLTQGRGITVPSLTTVVEAALPIIVNRESLFLHNSDLNRFRMYDGTVYQSVAYLSDSFGIYKGSGALAANTEIDMTAFSLSFKSAAAPTAFTINNTSSGNEFCLIPTIAGYQVLRQKFAATTSQFHEYLAGGIGFSFESGGTSGRSRHQNSSATNWKFQVGLSTTGFEFTSNTGGPLHKFYTMGALAGSVVFNETGLTSGDFRVEGLTDANLLFTDASNDNIGIGLNAPDANAKLDVDGVVKVKSYLVAALPTVVAGGTIYVSDETGGATLAYSNGVNWLRVYDAAIVS